ncbi:MAG: fumarylacetoacetate hydrolase family protein [Pseudomonadales bacterium]
MKLASLKGGRDGGLVVVSRDLRHACPVPDVAATLQQALDDWHAAAPRLEAVYRALNEGTAADAQPFDPIGCAAPLPRAYQWADGSAYVNHVALVRQARGAEMPARFWHDPLMYQGGSDTLLGPHDDIAAASEDWGIDFEAELAVITGDVPMGVSAADALACVRLLTLVNDVSLRALIPDEVAKGFGFFHSKPSSAFAPVALTPDELGGDWRDGRVHGPVLCHVNDELLGTPDAGRDMTFGFDVLIAHAAKTRRLGAGSIIGSGTVSNLPEDESRITVAEGGVGHACIAEARARETVRYGAPRTPFLRFGDRVRIEMTGPDGVSRFGAIDQPVTQTSSR